MILAMMNETNHDVDQSLQGINQQVSVNPRAAQVQMSVLSLNQTRHLQYHSLFHKNLDHNHHPKIVMGER